MESSLEFQISVEYQIYSIIYCFFEVQNLLSTMEANSSGQIEAYFLVSLFTSFTLF